MQQSLRTWPMLAGLIALCCLSSAARAIDLNGAQWLWSSKYNPLEAPKGPLYFRKTVELGEVKSAKFEITCDNSYELSVNGRRVGAGRDWQTLDFYDVTQFLIPGLNVIAVRGENEGPGAAGLVARLVVKQKGKDQKVVTVVTDASWKHSLQAAAGWDKPDFNDEKWEPARSLGAIGQVGPWRDQVRLAGEPAVTLDRFSPLEGFAVEEVVTPGETGSLVAMTFNERGEILASRERGPLILVRDANGDGTFEQITTFCDAVTNCQGMLCLDGRVYAVGNGPKGTAFYRLTDADASGQAEQVVLIFPFRGGMGEHGPHQPILGPDGLIYIMVGNHAGAEKDAQGNGPAATSPHHHYYDGELLTPKYEDANGHASGIKAPGGTVVRTDRNGSFLELFVGGFRNAYDIAFNREGELFTYDSDMEWDVGLPWYRATRVNHLIPGGEYGWRSGWSKWPDHFADSLPTTLDIGRGSPTGVEFYNHTRFPEKYRNAFFMCDWSQGRIVAVTMKPAGGTYDCQSEIFLEGKPLNCSDIAVGPDGWLYFSVGGRNTQGSLFRIVTADKKPLAPSSAAGVQRAIEQPQLYSAWARHQILSIRDEAGARWGPLKKIAVDAKAEPASRVRALDLMQQFGPVPAKPSLVKLSQDNDVEVRAKATYLMGLHADEATNARLVALLDDADPRVRRGACESLVRAKHPAPVEKLVGLLADPNRWVAWAARRAMEQLPKQQWQSRVLSAESVPTFIHGGVALLVMAPDRPTVDAVLARAGQLLNDKQLSDDNLVGVLRVIELALYRGEVKPDEVAHLRSQLATRYPATEWRVNRELVRLLAYLQEPTFAPALLKQLHGETPLIEKIHTAMYARFLQSGWTPELRNELLGFYDSARVLPGGNSYRGYLTNAANDVLKSLPAAEQLELLASGAKSPGLALGLVQSLPAEPTAEHLAVLRELDRVLAADKSPPARELAKAVLMAIARGDERSLTYLHQVFESSPERRQDVAQAVSAYTIGKKRREEDFRLLLRSLTVVEGNAARDVLRALARFQQRGTKGEHQRMVILLGLKLKDQGGQDAAKLLQHWTGKKVLQNPQPVDVELAAWQKWFAEAHPELPEAVLPVEAEGTKYTYAQLMTFLTSDKGLQGDAGRGAAVFEKGLCIKCHRYGPRGEGIGPDLSNVASRFQRKEMVESVVFPSQVISDQFAAKTVITADGRTFTGIVGPAADGVVVLQPNAEKVTISKADIDEIVPSKKSAMPDNLFNPLTLAEIADLFAYMSKPPAAGP